MESGKGREGWGVGVAKVSGYCGRFHGQTHEGTRVCAQYSWQCFYRFPGEDAGIGIGNYRRPWTNYLASL